MPDGSRILGNNFQEIIPNCVKFNKGGDALAVADAKYVALKGAGREITARKKATDIYYKTIAYMRSFAVDKAYPLYPPGVASGAETPEKIESQINKNTRASAPNNRAGPQTTESAGSLIKVGLKIPRESESFPDFVKRMEMAEKRFLNILGE